MVGYNEQTKNPQLNPVFEWTGELKDTFEMRGQSNVFKQIAESKHVPEEDIYSDMEQKQQILEWLLQKNIRSYKAVASIIRGYYYNPQAVHEMARLGEDWHEEMV